MEIVNSPREGTVPLSLGCSLYHPLVAGSGNWAELSSTVMSLVPQTRKPKVIIPQRSCWPPWHVESSPPRPRHDTSLTWIPLTVSAPSSTTSRERPFLTTLSRMRHFFSGWPCCSTPRGALPMLPVGIMQYDIPLILSCFIQGSFLPSTLYYLTCIYLYIDLLIDHPQEIN